MNPPNKKPPASRGIAQLQKKGSSSQAPLAGQGQRRPVAPPVYRPQARKIVQPKVISQPRILPTAPPVYRPEQKRIAQPKMAASASAPRQRVVQRAEDRFRATPQERQFVETLSGVFESGALSQAELDSRRVRYEPGNDLRCKRNEISVNRIRSSEIDKLNLAEGARGPVAIVLERGERPPVSGSVAEDRLTEKERLLIGMAPSYRASIRGNHWQPDQSAREEAERRAHTTFMVVSKGVKYSAPLDVASREDFLDRIPPEQIDRILVPIHQAVQIGYFLRSMEDQEKARRLASKIFYVGDAATPRVPIKTSTPQVEGASIDVTHPDFIGGINYLRRNDREFGEAPELTSHIVKVPIQDGEFPKRYPPKS
jgi:hypothetical protein